MYLTTHKSFRTNSVCVCYVLCLKRIVNLLFVIFFSFCTTVTWVGNMFASRLKLAICLLLALTGGHIEGRPRNFGPSLEVGGKSQQLEVSAGDQTAVEKIGKFVVGILSKVGIRSQNSNNNGNSNTN